MNLASNLNSLYDTEWENDTKHPTWHYMASHRVVEYSEIYYVLVS